MFALHPCLNIELPQVTILDVGARFEDQVRYATLVDQSLAQVIGFEPAADAFAHLQQLARPNSRYFPYALGRGGPARFHITGYPGCCSIYEPDPTVIERFHTMNTTRGGNFYVMDTVEIETHRLDDIADCPAPDYLKLDVQGAEMDVMIGGEQKVRQALVIETEVEFVPLYKNQPVFGDLHVWLRDRGFMLHKMIDVRGRTIRPLVNPQRECLPISQMLSADAIFVRDFTKLEHYRDEELLKAALVLHDVYWSYDLVHYWLLEYDRRRQTQLAATYLAQLNREGVRELQFLNVLNRL